MDQGKSAEKKQEVIVVGMPVLKKMGDPADKMGDPEVLNSKNSDMVRPHTHALRPSSNPPPKRNSTPARRSTSSLLPRAPKIKTPTRCSAPSLRTCAFTRKSTTNAPLYLPTVAPTHPLWLSRTHCGFNPPIVALAHPLWLSLTHCGTRTHCGSRAPTVDLAHPLWLSPTQCGSRPPTVAPTVALAHPLWLPRTY